MELARSRRVGPMAKAQFTDADIRGQRAMYARALKRETQASVSVREMWRKLVAMLDELLQYRRTK